MANFNIFLIRSIFYFNYLYTENRYFFQRIENGENICHILRIRIYMVIWQYDRKFQQFVVVLSKKNQQFLPGQCLYGSGRDLRPFEL